MFGIILFSKYNSETEKKNNAAMTV